MAMLFAGGGCCRDGWPDIGGCNGMVMGFIPLMNREWWNPSFRMNAIWFERFCCKLAGARSRRGRRPVAPLLPNHFVKLQLRSHLPLLGEAAQGKQVKMQ